MWVAKTGAQEGKRRELGQMKIAPQKWEFRGTCTESENGCVGYSVQAWES